MVKPEPDDDAAVETFKGQGRSRATRVGEVIDLTDSPPLLFNFEKRRFPTLMGLSPELHQAVV